MSDLKEYASFDQLRVAALSSCLCFKVGGRYFNAGPRRNVNLTSVWFTLEGKRISEDKARELFKEYRK